MTDKIVMCADSDAATQVTMTGWQSRSGVFYGTDERMARFEGCTHVPCGTCGTPVEKQWLLCKGCRDLAEVARYGAMPVAKWDGEAMLYSQLLDRYFRTPQAAADELEAGRTMVNLRLVICMPNRGRPLDADYFCDELAEDGDLPSCLHDAIDAFNEALEKAPELSWSPGPFALFLSPRLLALNP